MPYDIVICGLSGCTNIFPHYLINGTIFGETLLKVKCVFFISPQLLSETFLILRRIQRDTITNIHWSSRDALVFLIRFWWSWNFLGLSWRNTHKLSLKSVQWEPFGGGEQADTTKLAVAFRYFTNAPYKKWLQKFTGVASIRSLNSANLMTGSLRLSTPPMLLVITKPPSKRLWRRWYPNLNTWKTEWQRPGNPLSYFK